MCVFLALAYFVAQCVELLGQVAQQVEHCRLCRVLLLKLVGVAEPHLSRLDHVGVLGLACVEALMRCRLGG